MNLKLIVFFGLLFGFCWNDASGQASPIWRQTETATAIKPTGDSTVYYLGGDRCQDYLGGKTILTKDFNKAYKGCLGQERMDGGPAKIPAYIVAKGQKLQVAFKLVSGQNKGGLLQTGVAYGPELFETPHSSDGVRVIVPEFE